MDPTVSILLLWAAFTGTHLGLSSLRLRPRLVAGLGETGYLGLYSVVALAIFVPLMWIYFGGRHAGAWWWVVPVGPVVRVLLYAVMTLAVVLVIDGVMAPSPASMTSSEARAADRVRGALRVTRHPLVLGVGLLMALHLISNASTGDIAFFGGFVVFTLLGAWHQDQRKLASGDAEFRAFYEATRFVPFSHPDALRGLAEIPPLTWAIGIAASAGMRWLHPNGIWPH